MKMGISGFVDDGMVGWWFVILSDEQCEFEVEGAGH